MKKKIFIFFIIILLITITLIYKNIIFQDGNPLPIFRGIIKLNSSETYVKTKEHNPVTYLTKTSNKEDLFEYIEKEKKVKFIEQLGSSYIFEGIKKNITMTSRQYTRFYTLWYYSEQNI